MAADTRKRNEPMPKPRPNGARKRTTRTSAKPAVPAKKERKPIAPYLAVGLSTVVYGVAERKHIRRNLATIEDAVHAAVGVISINMPIKVIALAEGALTGFTDEIFDVPH